MKIGILCATPRELAPLLERLENHTCETFLMREFHSGRLCGLETLLVIGGVGKVNAAMTAQALITRFGVQAVLFTGLAGGLDDRLSVGDVVIGTEILYHDFDMELMNNNQFPGLPTDFFSSDPHLTKLCRGLGENLYFGRIISGEVFVQGALRDDLIRRFSPLCVDMESAAVCQLCWFYRVPVLIIRALSDFSDADAGTQYEQNAARSSVSALSVVLRVVERLAAGE